MALRMTILTNVVVQRSATVCFVDFDVQMVVGDFDLGESIIEISAVQCTAAAWSHLGTSASTHHKQRFPNVVEVIVETHLVGVAANHQLDIVLCKKRTQKRCVASGRLVVLNSNLPSRGRMPEGISKPMFLFALHVPEPTQTFMRVCSWMSSSVKTNLLTANATTPGTERGILHIGIEHEQF